MAYTFARLRAIDVAAGSLFLLLALALWLGRWGGMTPFALLGGDAANVASFASARVAPERFTADALLSDPRHFTFYNTLHVWVLVALHRLGMDSGSGYLLFHIPAVTFQGLGFYALGVVWLRSRAWGLALAIGSFWTVPAFAGDYWGLWRDPQPRMVFQAVLPWIMLATVACSGQRIAICLLFGAVGILTYIHPPSGPVLAGMVGCGLYCTRSRDVPKLRYIGSLILGGALYLLIITPFGVLLWSTSQSASQGIAPETALAAAALRFQSAYLNLPQGFLQAGTDIWAGSRGWLPILIITLALIHWRWMRQSNEIRLLAGMLLGVICVSVLLPLADFLIARWRGSYPMQFDLCRGIRFHIPLLLVLGALLVHQSLLRFPQHWHKVVAASYTVAWSVSAVTHNPFEQPFNHAWQLLRCGIEPACLYEPYTPHVTARLELIKYLASPVFSSSTRFLAPQFGLAVRYAALRPLAFDYKDGAILPYVDHPRLLVWAEQARLFQRLALDGPKGANIRAQVDFCREVKAHYLVTPVRAHDLDHRERNSFEIVFSNDAGMVIGC